MAVEVQIDKKNTVSARFCRLKLHNRFLEENRPKYRSEQVARKLIFRWNFLFFCITRADINKILLCFVIPCEKRAL